MHGFSDKLPGRHLFGGFDTRCVGVALAECDGKNAFRDDQSGADPLPVVGRDQIIRDVVVSTRTRPGCHDHSVGEGVAYYLDFGKKCVHYSTPRQ